MCEFEHNAKETDMEPESNDEVITLDDQSDDAQVGCTFFGCSFLDQVELQYHMRSSYSRINENQFLPWQTQGTSYGV